MSRFATSIPSILLAAMAALPVAAETTLCTTITPPLVISRPGIYCLQQDFALSLTSGAAIEVTANNVTIDLNGHRIGNVAGGTAQTSAGVYSGAAIQNLTVRNGILRGFYNGLFLNGNGMGHMFEDLLIDQSLSHGAFILASDTVLRRNRIQATGSWGDSGLYGIDIEGDGNRLLDNDVTNTTACSTCQVTGIYINGHRFVVANNRVTGMAITAPGPKTGIWAVIGGVIRDNVVVDEGLPAGSTSYGIKATTAGGTIKLMGNLVDVPGTPYSGGTQVGTTNF